MTVAKKIVLCMLLLLSISLTCYQSSIGLDTGDEALYLYQTSGIIGDQDIYITGTAVRIENKTSGLISIARAPSWKVTTFHNGSKSICALPLQSFHGYIPEKAFLETGAMWNTIPFEKSDSKEIAGTASTVFTTTGAYTEKQLKDWQREFADSKFIKSARYCVAEKLAANQKARSVLLRFYSLPDKGGLPLEFKYHDLGGNFHTGLITSSQRSVKADSVSFEIPKDYKAVPNNAELFKVATTSKVKRNKRRPLL